MLGYAKVRTRLLLSVSGGTGHDAAEHTSLDLNINNYVVN